MPPAQEFDRPVKKLSRQLRWASKIDRRETKQNIGLDKNRHQKHREAKSPSLELCFLRVLNIDSPALVLHLSAVLPLAAASRTRMLQYLACGLSFRGAMKARVF